MFYFYPCLISIFITDVTDTSYSTLVSVSCQLSTDVKRPMNDKHDIVKFYDLFYTKFCSLTECYFPVTTRAIGHLQVINQKQRYMCQLIYLVKYELCDYNVCIVFRWRQYEKYIRKQIVSIVIYNLYLWPTIPISYFHSYLIIILILCFRQ